MLTSTRAGGHGGSYWTHVSLIWGSLWPRLTHAMLVSSKHSKHNTFNKQEPPTLFVSPVQRDMPSKPDSFPGLPGILSCPATTHILCGLQKMLYGNKCWYIYVVVKQFICWKYSSMDPCLHLQWVRWDLWAPFLEEGSSHLWGPGAGWGPAGGEGWEKGGGQGSPHLGLQGGANLSSLIRFFKSHSATLSATLFRICTIFSSPQWSHPCRSWGLSLISGADMSKRAPPILCLCVTLFCDHLCVCDCVTHTVRPFFALFISGLDWPPSTVELPRSIWGDWGICPQSPELINTS